MKEIKNKNIYVGKIECPKCNSMNTVANNKGSASLGMSVMLIVVGFGCLLIPLVGLLLAPVALIGSVISFIVFLTTVFSKEYTVECLDCKSKYKINKKEYKSLAK